MIDFVVYSLGCKVNQVEGQSLVLTIKENGFSVTDKLVEAKCYIINTCSVTSEADRKSRQTVSRVLKLNPKARVFIMGCSSQNDAEKFASKDNVEFVSGVGGKEQSLEKIIKLVKEEESCAGKKVNNNFTSIVDVKTLPTKFEHLALPLQSRTRAYIKIQDGCNNFCSYCIVPYLRGRSRSRDLENIVAEAKVKSEQAKEIVLTGIDISDYKIDGQNALVTLVKALGGISVQKRIGSLECRVITLELLEAMRDNGFCDHFHLSLQSGCDSVLKRMNRHYTTDEYYQKVQLIRQIMPNSSITTDIILGFPQETEQEFNETVAFVEKVKFASAHIFPYSERKGTKAYNMPMVDKKIRSLRATELSTLCKQHTEVFLQSQIGRTVDVYVEESGDDGYNSGHTSNYIKVYTDKPTGDICTVKLKELYKDGIKA